MFSMFFLLPIQTSSTKMFSDTTNKFDDTGVQENEVVINLKAKGALHLVCEEAERSLWSLSRILTETELQT